MRTDAGTARALRRWPGPGVIVIVVALIGAFFVSRGCQRGQVRITKEQAVAVGQRYVPFKPQDHAIRMVLRGVPPRRYWAISYFIRNATGGGFKRCVQVLMSANTGKVPKGYPRNC